MTTPPDPGPPGSADVVLPLPISTQSPPDPGSTTTPAPPPSGG